MNPQEMILSRSQEIELNLLCEMLLTRRVPLDVSPELFEGAEHKLFTAAQSMYQRTGDIDPQVLKLEYPEVVAAALNRSGTYSRPAIEVLKAHAQLRAAGTALLEFGRCSSFAEGIRTLQSNLAAVLTDTTRSRYDHGAACVAVWDSIQKRVSGDAGAIGLRCGIAAIDSILRGFHRGKLYTVGALKKTGKSRFMVYLVNNFLAQGAAVTINSLEMGAHDLNELRLCYYAGADVGAIGPGTTAKSIETLHRATQLLQRKQWHICRCLTTDELRAEIAHQRVNGGCDVVFVDFMQMMRSPIHKGDRTREVEAVARGLADLARSEQVAIIALCQLSGEAERLDPEQVPRMAHAKESQAIGECTDWFLTLHNYNRNKPPFDSRGNYVPQSFGIRTEGRYNASGSIARVRADLRTCRFSAEDCPSDDEAAQWVDT
jgi:replicative DNA helicase